MITRNKCCWIICLLAVLAFCPAGRLLAQADAVSLHAQPGIDSFYEVPHLLVRSSRLADSGKMEAAALLAEDAARLAVRNQDVPGQVSALALQAKLAFKAGNSPQALFYFWQSVKLKSAVNDKGVSERLYYNMAVTLASMKRYALALKYFDKASWLKARKAKREVPPVYEPVSALADADGEEDEPADALPDVQADSVFRAKDSRVDLLGDNAIVMDSDTIMIRQTNQKRRERKLTGAAIMDAFDDGRQAVAYGLLLHIKQPVSGRRKAYAGINTVGHMFVTLIKYNYDGGYVSRTFGFYPDKDYFLSATPFSPGSSATFRDDAAHEWDETIAKFISRKNFRRVLRMVRKYSKVKYNLNHNNCTDFGLCIAGVAGIKISDTHGSWPFGSGNNPGSAGQSVLDNKVEDMDQEDLMIIDTINDPLR